MLQIAIITAVIAVFACMVQPLKCRMPPRLFTGLMWCAAFVYLAGFLYFTLLSRTPAGSSMLEWRPLASYVRMCTEAPAESGNALNGWLAQYFLHPQFPLQGIILNVLLFVPMGYLLPMLFPRWTRRRVLLTALAVTVATELTQLVTHLGWCEMDDVLHNMLGAALGQMLYARQNKYEGRE